MSRKLIKEESRCDKCDNITDHKKHAYFCDGCDKLLIDEYQNRDDAEDFINITIHNKSGPAIRHEYCSWKCCLKHLRTLDSDYFISMPFLQYDNVSDGTRASDFFALLKEDLD